MEFAFRIGRWWFSVETGINAKKLPAEPASKTPKFEPTVGFYMSNHDYVEETPLHLE